MDPLFIVMVLVFLALGVLGLRVQRVVNRSDETNRLVRATYELMQQRLED